MSRAERPVAGSVSIGVGLGLCALAVLGFAALAGVAIGIELAGGAPLVRALSALRSDTLLFALCQLGGFALATGAGVLTAFGSETPYREALDVRPVPAAISVLALGAGLALQLPLSEVANLLGALHPSLVLEHVVRIDSLRDAITIPLALVVIPAIGQELFLRGLLVPGLAIRYGPRVALAASAIASGLFAGALGAVVPAMLLGLALGTVRLRTGSVLPCVALHGAFHAVRVILPSNVLVISGFNTFGARASHIPLALVIVSAIVAAVCLTLLARLTQDEE